MSITHIVTVTPASDEWIGDHFVVRTTVAGIAVDRPDLFGFAVKTKRLADRLATAITAGAVFHGHEVRRDVNGKSYVAVSSRVMAKYANADLKRLGY
ncbi:hypothetical protein SEA_EDEN_31 [Microbacterium phage Eden]|uniref:Uncharacterized protein n=1 Tax=Microbacterium phage Eden TaxID=2250289 RepID=A0A345KWC4_9CAUD|nr:hypothetical protein HOT71_gp31 [Microbacterium phage Eden]AXH47326.1 hypothetical protein SEA_EDEN_31 [Microbacterium phage Eden]